MRRPLMIVGFTIFASLAVLFRLNLTVVVSLLIPLVPTSVLLLIFRKKFKADDLITVIASITVAASLVLVYNVCLVEPYRVYDGKSVTVKGYVTKSHTSGFVFRTSLDGKPTDIYVSANLDSVPQLGVCLEMPLKLTFVGNENAEASMRSYLLSNRCYVSASFPVMAEVALDIHIPWLDRTLIRINQFLTVVQTETFSEDTVGFIQGLTLGKRDAVSEEVTIAFKRTGLSHILAISGMHITVMSQIFYVLFQFLGRRASSIITIVFTLFYIALTGFQQSVSRAGLMAILLLLGNVFWQDYDPLTSVGAAVLVLCFINPAAAGDVSLQMSVVSTVGIIVLFVPLNRKIDLFICSKKGKRQRLYRLLFAPVRAFLISFCANLVLIPFYIFVFGYFSTVTLLANIPASFISNIVLFSSVIATLLACFPLISAVAFIPGFVADISTTCLMNVAKFFAQFKYALVDIHYGFACVWLLITVVLVAFMLVRKTKAVLTTSLTSIILLFSFIFCYTVYNNSVFTLHVVPSGTNGCVVLQGHGQTVVVGDLTSEYEYRTMRRVLLEKHVDRVDLLVVPTVGNVSYVPSVIVDFGVEKFVYGDTPQDEILSFIQERTDCEVLPIENSRSIALERFNLYAVQDDSGINLRLKVDEVVFNLNRDTFQTSAHVLPFGGTDVALVGESTPQNHDWADLAYILITDVRQQESVLKDVYYLTRNIGFLDQEMTFVIRNNHFSEKGGLFDAYYGF